MADEHVPEGPVDLALEFVRFCHHRRHVAWPHIYDEMCNVAGHGLFRGMSYLDLAEHGISFGLNGMPRLAELTQRVIAEEGGPGSEVENVPSLASLNLAPAN